MNLVSLSTFSLTNVWYPAGQPADRNNSDEARSHPAHLRGYVTMAKEQKNPRR